MTDLFFERLRHVLRPEFEAERVLGQGGMGLVVLAREVKLGRRVAIKTIRPEAATAVAVERFLREAQTLAALAHPHIVPIHRHDERDGIPFIVMEHLEGETLAERLARGPLSAAEVTRIGRDLLAALEAAHGRGVIHRDIKPSNIFLRPHGAVLVDFGIAKSPERPGEELTVPGQAIGTVAYMSPEQLAGADLTPASDLYALALVLYEAGTGRPWVSVADPAAANWTGVGRRSTVALQRALAFSPEDRFASAAEFRRALQVPRRGRLLPWALAAAAAGAVLLGSWALRGGEPARLPDLAIGRISGATAEDSALGEDLMVVVGEILRGFEQRLTVAPVSRAVGSGTPPAARHRVEGRLQRRGDEWSVDLAVRDSAGNVLASRRVAGGAERYLFGERIALAVIDAVKPGTLPPHAVCAPSRVEAVRAWLDGEAAFRRDDWQTAQTEFERAVAVDPDFCVPEFRLWIVQRWRRVTITVSPARLLARHGERLPESDRLLLQAEVAPTRAERWRLYAAAVDADPFRGYAPLLYGGELFHRGALDGVPLDSAIVLLREALRRDPSLAPAHDHLVWALVRLGRRDEALAALRALQEHAVAGARRAVPPDAFAFALAGRFENGGAIDRLASGAAGSLAPQLGQLARLGLSFDIAPVQRDIGRRLTADRAAPATIRAHGYVAAALALIALGAPVAATAQFDSAVALVPPLALSAAEWRVLARALDVPGMPDAFTAAGRAQLVALGADPAAMPRATWALGVDALARGDSGSARTAAGQLRAAAPLLGTLLDGLMEPDARRALARTDALRGWDEEQNRLGSPFARALLHLRRAEWFDRIGNPTAAARERRWHEASTFDGWLEGDIQATEIDWATGTFVRFREAVRRVRGGDGGSCPELRRVLELWRNAEPAVRVLALDGEGLAAERCR